MLGDIAWRGFSLAFGLTNFLALAGTAAFRDGAFTKSASEEERKELAVARKKYWSLDAEPIPGFTHEFFTTKNGVKIHYVVNCKTQPTEARNVAIFIHGFPDSFMLWRQLLKAPGLQSCILIAVDLPGYGGSDGLSQYSANEMLEAVTAFIIEMREKYVQENAKVVIASHDWGGIVASRLASEAKELADRWIIAGAVIPGLLLANTKTLSASSKQMLHTYLRHPFNFRLVKRAFATLSPVFSQVSRSFYIFIFNLPKPIANFAVRMGDYWFLRILQNAAAGLYKNRKLVRKMSPSESGDWMAMCSGPSVAEIQSTGDLAYPDSVRARASDYGAAEKLRIYREGLFSTPWEKSLETVIALSDIAASSTSKPTSGAGLFEEGPPGALKAPATILYGKYDPAFERRLALDGVSDYLVKGSQVLIIDGAGHWLPHEGLGAKVLEDVVEWAIGDEKQPLKTRFDGLPDVKFTLEK